MHTPIEHFATQYVSRDTLRDHVRQSNEFTGCIASPQRNLSFDEDHIDAALLVSYEGRLLNPEYIHQCLMISHRSSEAGRYRTRGATVRGRPMPEPEAVPHLMRQWRMIVDHAIDLSLSTPDERARLAWCLHDALLAIHPFTDGNGRTARLVLNNIRLCLGLEWHVVPQDKQQMYYRHIRTFEETEFSTSLCYRDMFW